MQMGLIERLFGWLGIVADTAVGTDPDEYMPIVDPLASPARLAWMGEERAERIRLGVEPCPHLSETPYGMFGDEPLYRCDDCCLVYRHIVDPDKPWLIRAYQPVGVKR